MLSAQILALRLHLSHGAKPSAYSVPRKSFVSVSEHKNKQRRRLCARHALGAALPSRGAFAGCHLCWEVSLPRQSVERGRFLPGGVDLTPSCPQGAFPARLKKVFIVGAPMWFRVPYSIISLLLKEKLRERVSECGGPPSTARHPRWGGQRLFSPWDRMV